ncbi:hypothetical protein [uncultured Anaerococcus sp.]|uniref:hypothetical protein n=1 Tax=uncultured Anaerococcus sp. TaxID=293428 RepID=UPI0025EC5AE1|nr:hypothetical protein [uncultured Anaerococcus sp.]
MKVSQLINLLYEYSIGDEDEIKILADINGDELVLTIDGAQSIEDNPVFYIKASEE